MKQLSLTLMLSLLASQPCMGAEAQDLRTINTKAGEILLLVPNSWPAIETRQTSRGNPYYRLTSPSGDFYFNIYLNDPAQVANSNVLSDSDLERSLESSLSSTAKKSVEGTPEPHRFGPKKDGVYVRLTDRAPKPGEYRYFTRGMRLIGTNVVTFSLLSNDKDFSALSNTLAIVEGVRVQGGLSGKTQ